MKDSQKLLVLFNSKQGQVTFKSTFNLPTKAFVKLQGQIKKKLDQKISLTTEVDVNNNMWIKNFDLKTILVQKYFWF